MTPSPVNHRLLIVDDEADMAERLQEMLTEELADLGDLSLQRRESFDEAEHLLSREQFDLVILDVRDSGGNGDLARTLEGRGRELFERISGSRWVPVVFYTGVPEQVRSLEQPPLVQVVTKNRLPEIVEAVRVGLESGVPSLTRRIGELVDGVLRSFLRDEIAPHWSDLSENDRDEIAPVLVHRLAAWLKENAIRELDRVLDGSGGSTVGHSSAARVYLKPPVTHHVTAADILLDPAGQRWLVLTPACDLYEDPPSAMVASPRTAKAEFVRLAKADPLSESQLVREVKAGVRSKDQLRDIIREKSNRFRILPKYLDIPDLLVDFENVTSVPLSDVSTWGRVATLDSPFAEAWLTTHSRVVGRIGTPDIRLEHIEQEFNLVKIKKARKQISLPGPRPGELQAAGD
ncbi:hypothetical protein ACTWP5_22400 [Streptomyces sp. 4N509B]|uniref:hypothetical protein n=1 Tax=Streptomyces sp. 4N509B TaxID=3457413 RepID=UPI003FD1FEB8